MSRYAPDRPGYFIRPTIVRDIAEGTRLVDEEQFGPIVRIREFDQRENCLLIQTVPASICEAKS